MPRPTSPFLWAEDPQPPALGSCVTSWLRSQAVGQRGLQAQEGAQPRQHWGRGSMLAHVLLPLPTWWAIFRHKAIVLLAGPSTVAGPNFLLGARICNPMKVAGPGKLPVFSAGLSPEQFYFHQKCSLALPHVQAYMKPPRRLPPPAILFS